MRRIERRFGRYQVHIQATPMEHGGSRLTMQRQNTNFAYLPLVVVRMYVIARLQKVDKNFFTRTNVSSSPLQDN